MVINMATNENEVGEIAEQLDELALDAEDAVVEDISSEQQGDITQKDIDAAVLAKEEGNVCFRNKEYDEAIEHFSRAIAYCPENEENKESLATFYGNRSAAYFSVEEYELVVEDCSQALELKPDYCKVLVRRMQANEKLDKVEDALTGLLLVTPEGIVSVFDIICLILLTDAKQIKEIDPAHPKINEIM